MALTNGPNLGLLVNGNAGEGHYTDLMKQWRGLDALVMPNVKGYLVNTPPGSPSDGDCYIIGAAPTGAWAGKGGKVTRWSSVANAWEFYAPKNGWTVQANSAREVYRYTGGAWEIFYQEGTWTPIATNLGGSGIAITTKYVRAGSVAHCTVTITGTGLTATGGSTSITNPFTSARVSTVGACNGDVGGYVSGVSASTLCYLPTIASTSEINLTWDIYFV